MTSTVCKAKNPDECRYHGTRSTYHTTRLKNTMVLARDVYKAAETQSEKMEAFFNLQNSEVEYYGTEEGRTSLIHHINTTDNAQHRSHWLQILDKADAKREFFESQDNTWAPPLPPRIKPLLFGNLVTHADANGHQVTPLSTGKYDNGVEYHFEWDETRGMVFYEETDDVESMRGLGKATTLEQAKKVSETWYQSQHIKTRSLQLQ
jgi:hypothetical protein